MKLGCRKIGTNTGAAALVVLLCCPGLNHVEARRASSPRPIPHSTKVAHEWKPRSSATSLRGGELGFGVRRSLVAFVGHSSFLLNQHSKRVCHCESSPSAAATTEGEGCSKNESVGDVDDGTEGDGINTLESMASKLAKKSHRNVVVVVGAGVSVSAGIPDFRTKGTGLYDMLEEYNLPYPEAVFDIDYYRSNPRPFVDLARSLWPGQEGGPRPTLAHSFLRVLERRGVLRRVYTQNIDGLERLAGVSTELLMECHGHFRSARCSSPRCGEPVHAVEEECMGPILRGEVPKCSRCGSPTKPDVVFFGEQLPVRFQNLIEDDMAECDMLIVMGTSLLVAPVASIPAWVDERCPRLLLNRELVGDFAMEKVLRGKKGPGRDVFVKGDCDDGVRKLCQLARWEDELDEVHSAAGK